MIVNINGDKTPVSYGSKVKLSSDSIASARSVKIDSIRNDSRRELQKSRLQQQQKSNDKPSNGKELAGWILKKCGLLTLTTIGAVIVLTGVGIAVGIGLKYITPQLYGGKCSKNSECFTISDYGFVCINGSCNCSNTAYYIADKYSCVAKKTYLAACDSKVLCNDNIGLQCSSSKCVCSNQTKWKGSSCEFGTANEACNVTSPCKSSAGLSCIASTCSCSNGFFWNTANCDPIRTFGGSCIGNLSCNATQLLYCPLQTGQTQSTCKCPNLLYWNSTTNLCVNQKTVLSVCSSSIECRQDLGLSCTSNNKCECASRYYWSSTNNACTLSSTLSEVCSASVPCDATLNLVCVSNKCECPNTRYWNSLTCTLKKDYNESCITSLECNDNIGLLCSASYCVCSSSSYFYNGTLCRTLRDYMEPCAATSECYTPGQLSCKNNSCDCPLPNSQKMYWVPAYQDCRILPKNCKEIQAADPSATSGIFYLASSVGLLEAYCEMVIDGGGYTFVPWASLSRSTSMLSDIYTDKTKILFRLISRNDNQVQPYVLTKQLSQFSSIPIGVQENSWSGYSTPQNLKVGSYVFIGFIPASSVVRNGAHGFIANGVTVSFTNCDGNPNSYFALFSNQNPTDPSGYSMGSGVLNTWKDQAIAHPQGTFMPNGYFYFGEMHQGGCGGYAQTDRWSDYFGLAFGMI